MHQFDLGVLLLLVILVGHAKTTSLPPVYKHGCVTLADQKLYCYGGALRTKPTLYANETFFDDDQLYDQFVYLDISKPLNVSSANTQWQAVEPSTKYPFQHEPRADFAIAALGPTGFVISGGIGPDINNTKRIFTNITMTYNAKNNGWKYGGMIEDGGGKAFNTFDTPMFGQRGVKVSDTEYAIFGGIPNDNNTVIRPNTTFVHAVAQNPDWNNNTAWTIPLTIGNIAYQEDARRHHGALAVGINSEVILFGGVEPQNATNNYNYADYIGYIPWDSLMAYHPQKKTFEAVITSDGSLSARIFHTVTTIPNANKMILYGGINYEEIPRDFCWLFHLSTRTWETVQFTNGEGPGRRFGHQAVMIGDDMLYIIGGMDAAGAIQKDAHILNVTSMTWLNGTYTNTYDQMMRPEAQNEPQNITSLSGGAIAGIVIGCVAGMAILATGAIILHIQRKKKKALMVPVDAPEGLNPIEFNRAKPDGCIPDECNKIKQHGPAPDEYVKIESDAPTSAPEQYGKTKPDSPPPMSSVKPSLG